MRVDSQTDIRLWGFKLGNPLSMNEGPLGIFPGVGGRLAGHPVYGKEGLNAQVCWVSVSDEDHQINIFSLMYSPCSEEG